jgi:hypothetical protein
LLPVFDFSTTPVEYSTFTTSIEEVRSEEIIFSICVLAAHAKVE